MRSEIKTIIFSKDRACQLELLLRNLNMPATILFAHEPEFEKGYIKLMKMYPNFKFIKETNFKKQIIKLVENEKYVMFMCDDDIMIEHFNESCAEFEEFKNNEDILCLSLRAKSSYKHAPKLIENKWKWKGERKDWGYPMSVTSHIFRVEDILQTIKREDFKTPGGLEMKLRRNAPDRELMFCFDTPKTINNLANRVQNKYPTPNHLGIPLVLLEENFLEGGLLSLDFIKEKAKTAKSCFIMEEYEWEDNWLEQFKKNITSQRGEDGIIEKIFDILDIRLGWFIDVGAYGKELSNTFNLIKKGWRGVLFEMDNERYIDLLSEYQNYDEKIYCVNEEVRPNGYKSLNNLLDQIVLPYDLDFLTIDVDGNDYYIWESLDNYIPKLIVIEFNPTFGFNNYLQDVDGNNGASLSKMIELGKKKGYELITTTNFNAFFIRKDLFNKFKIKNNSIHKLFVENNDSYGGKTKI